MRSRGTCYGYEVHSDLEFKYLRSGRGDALQVVTGAPPAPAGSPVRTWEPPHFPVHVKLYADGHGYQLWNEDAGWFGIEPDEPRLTVPAQGDSVRREERIWGLPVMLCFLARGDLALHASSVEVDGRALVLAAPRRFGKTTLASAFAATGYRVLSEDLTCVRPGPRPLVVPGPAMLRVRRDVADALAIPGATELGRDTDRLHLSLDAQRGSCDPIPLGAIAILLEDETDPRLDHIESSAVVPDLWSLSFKLPNEEDLARCFEGVAQVAFSTANWRLTRRLRIEDLRPTVECLVDALGEAS